MKNRNIFLFGFNWKSLTLLAFLAVLPNFFGMINLPTLWGFKIHIFQYPVFIAAAIYGPLGGLVSGAFGSLFSAITMNNPYILFGNMLLGFFAGWFFRKGFNLITAVLIAYAVQMPWLWLTDIYLVGMPLKVVNGLVIALFLSDIALATLTRATYKPINKIIS